MVIEKDSTASIQIGLSEEAGNSGAKLLFDLASFSSQFLLLSIPRGLILQHFRHFGLG